MKIHGVEASPKRYGRAVRAAMQDRRFNICRPQRFFWLPDLVCWVWWP